MKSRKAKSRRQKSLTKHHLTYNSNSILSIVICFFLKKIAYNFRLVMRRGSGLRRISLKPSRSFCQRQGKGRKVGYILLSSSVPSEYYTTTSLPIIKHLPYSPGGSSLKVGERQWIPPSTWSCPSLSPRPSKEQVTPELRSGTLWTVSWSWKHSTEEWCH